MATQQMGAAPPVNSMILTTADGAELVLRTWLPPGSIRQVVLTIANPGSTDSRVDAVGQACAVVGVATFALDLAAGHPSRAGWFGRRGRPDAATYQSELVSWMRMLYPGLPVWVLGTDGMASLVAASPAEVRRIVRRAVALT